MDDADDVQSAARKRDRLEGSIEISLRRRRRADSDRREITYSRVLELLVSTAKARQHTSDFNVDSSLARLDHSSADDAPDLVSCDRLRRAAKSSSFASVPLSVGAVWDAKAKLFKDTKTIL